MPDIDVARRAAIASIAASLAAGVATSCGGGSPEKERKRTTYRVWLPGPQSADGVAADKAFYKKILAPVAQKYGIRFEFTIIPWNSYEQKYLTGISSGDGPDIGYMYTEMMGIYIDHNVLRPLDEYMDDDFKQKMYYLDEGKFDGSQFSIPYVVGNPRVIYANSALLEKAGYSSLPETWEEFSECAASAAMRTKRYGVVMPWGESQRGMLNDSFFPFLWQAGGEIFNSEGTKTAFNGEPGVAAAAFLRQLLDVGAMPDIVSGVNGIEAEQIFKEGRSVFHFSSAAKYSEFMEAVPSTTFTDCLRRKKKATFIANDALVMTTACPDPEIGFEIIATMTAGRNMQAFHKQIVNYPPVGRDETAEADDPFSDMYKEKETLRGLPINGAGIPTYNALFESLQRLIVGQKTPEAALAEAAEQGDAALEAGN